MHLRLVPPASGTHRAGHDPAATPMTTRRAFGSAAKEQTAMYTVHQGPGLPQIHAESRRRDLLAEAAQERRLALAPRRTTPRRVGIAAAIAALRHGIGSALVRAGQRLDGGGAGRPADGLPGVGTLGAVR